jgi:hypothetical protein
MAAIIASSGLAGELEGMQEPETTWLNMKEDITCFTWAR